MDLRALNKKPTFLDLIKIKNEKRCFDYAKTIIAHSKFMKNELITLYQVPENKIEVIYPPVNSESFQPVNDDERISFRKKFNFQDPEIIFLFPSTGHERKGFNILKNYFNQSDLPIRLVVAGSPVTESKNITSLGYCKNMSELYQAVDYTIMASIYEPFGLVGIESILSGTPVIFSDNMGCLEVLENNFGYTFCRNNIDTLDKVIQNSVRQFSSLKNRISTPLDCITYNPCLSAHVEELLDILYRS